MTKKKPEAFDKDRVTELVKKGQGCMSFIMEAARADILRAQIVRDKDGKFCTALGALVNDQIVILGRLIVSEEESTLVPLNDEDGDAVNAVLRRFCKENHNHGGRHVEEEREANAPRRGLFDLN